jgi:hypothetical protein
MTLVKQSLMKMIDTRRNLLTGCWTGMFSSAFDGIHDSIPGSIWVTGLQIISIDHSDFATPSSSFGPIFQ